MLAGRWTFQLVEEFDDGYYADFKRLEQRVRDELMAGRRHVFEAEMKADRRTDGRAGHEATPADAADDLPAVQPPPTVCRVVTTRHTSASAVCGGQRIGRTAKGMTPDSPVENERTRTSGPLTRSASTICPLPM